MAAGAAAVGARSVSGAAEIVQKTSRGRGLPMGGDSLPFTMARELPTATRVPGVNGACQGLVNYEFGNEASSECAA